VLGEQVWEALARRNGAARVVVETGGNRALGGAAAGAFLGRRVEPAEVRLPGRLERRGDEIWDGAHTPEAVRHISSALPPLGSVVASILADKAVEAILVELGRLAPVLVATSSSNARALSAAELAVRAGGFFDHVEAVDDPREALGRAHGLGEPVLVTGSLYLLSDLWPSTVRA
jgi:folylpolyglutamate synthase/dihydropteroate synthase